MIVQKNFLANKSALPHSYKITSKNLALATFTGCTGYPALQQNFCHCSQSMNLLFGDRYTATKLGNNFATPSCKEAYSIFDN